MDENRIDLLPIREISRLTGVNSVTLRAWERRYGLIKPLRTHKGHRLYKPEDVELISQIQHWLARGLAIGKVSELLESGQPLVDTEVESIWQQYFAELLAIMAELSTGKLDALLNQLFSVYPAALIADQLIVPALEYFNKPAFGNGIKLQILVNRTSEYIFMLTQRQRQQASGKRVAIIQLTGAVDPVLNVLLHYGLVMKQIRSELIGLTLASEVVFACEQLRLDALILYNNSCSSLGDFQRELTLLAQKIALPICVGGSLVQVLDKGLPKNLLIAPESGQQSLMSVLEQALANLSASGYGVDA